MNRFVGMEFETHDGDKLTITEVFGYEPNDRSVGIFLGYLMVKCSDGNEYDILDNGHVHPAAESGSKSVGQVDLADLWGDCYC